MNASKHILVKWQIFPPSQYLYTNSLSLSLIGMKPKKKKKEIIIIWFYKTNNAKNILLNLEIKEIQIFIK